MTKLKNRCRQKVQDPTRLPVCRKIMEQPSGPGDDINPGPTSGWGWCTICGADKCGSFKGPAHTACYNCGCSFYQHA